MDNQRIDERASYAKEVEGECNHEEGVLADDGGTQRGWEFRHTIPGSTPLSPSLPSQSVRSEDTTSGSTTTRVVTLAQTVAGVPIPPLRRRRLQSSPQPPGDLSTAPTSCVTAPPKIVSRTTDSGGDGRTPEMWDDGGVAKLAAARLVVIPDKMR